MNELRFGEILLKETIETGSRKEVIASKKFLHEQFESKVFVKDGYFIKSKEIQSIGIDKPSTPKENGRWEGEKGDSIWYPEKNYTPPEKSKPSNRPYSNPDNLTMGELLSKYEIEGISFKNYYPDFSPISKGTVEIKDFRPGDNIAKDINFKKADMALAEKKGCSVTDVKEWRKTNNYTWHECEDRKTMQKVPNEIHANIPHEGGRAPKKNGGQYV